ncbi:MAG: carboxypeptidase regulatory-like domain-containing protein, partial [Terriglobales bacterium]
MFRRVFTNSLLRFAVLLLLSLVVIPSAHAQFRAALQGTIQDSTGAVISGATVTVKHQETGTTASTVSGDSGFYRVPSLAPGKYTVTVEAGNFKKSETMDVEVSAESVRGLDVKLEPGAVAESITVTEEVAGVQTENANISKNLGTLELQRLPQLGRDPYELLRLAPGVFGDGARNGLGASVSLPNATGPGGSNSAIFQTENLVQVSANGQRLSANNIQIDGVSVNSLTWGGAAVVTPNQESVQEIKVASSSYSAEDGRNSGAQVNVVSRTGTNEFHGSAFIKVNDPGLNAYNKFFGRTESPSTLVCEAGTLNEFQLDSPGDRCPERVNQHLRQFGGSFGGPIVKEKLFFFFSYEGFRRNATDFPVRYVETDQYLQDVIANRPGSVTATVFSAAGIEPRIASELTPTCADVFVPCAVVPGGLDLGSLIGATGTYNLLGVPEGSGLDGIPDIRRVQLTVPSRFEGDQFNGRVDWSRGSDRISGSLYYTRSDNFSADAAGGARPIADLSSLRHNWSATGNWIRTLSSTLLNEARFNFTRWSFNEVESNPDVNFGIPRIEVEGMLTSGDRIRFGAPRSEGTPGIFAETQYELRDTVSKVWHSHAFKFGFEHRWEQADNNLLGGSRPLNSFVRLWNLANDTPIFIAINADPRTGSSADADAQRNFRNRNISWFVQDDWKIRPNLTLN